MTDKPCADCKHSQWWRPYFLPDTVSALVCAHPSALRINEGAVWIAVLARERCKGVRFERRKGGDR